MKEELINSIEFTKEEYNEKTNGEGFATFDEFIDNIISSVEENNGTLEDAIFIANDSYNNL